VGVVRDVYTIAGTALAAVALGYEARTAFPFEGTLYLVDDERNIRPFVPRPPVSTRVQAASAGVR